MPHQRWADLNQFNKAYNAATVHLSSVLFSPTDIGPLADNKQHNVAYRNGLSNAWFCSEPKRIRASTYEDLARGTRRLFEQHRFREMRHVSKELRNSIREIVSVSMRNMENLIQERVQTRRDAGPIEHTEDRQAFDDVLVAREMARIDLGVDLVLAQPRSGP
jgi:hypothetical protein